MTGPQDDEFSRAAQEAHLDQMDAQARESARAIKSIVAALPPDVAAEVVDSFDAEKRQALRAAISYAEQSEVVEQREFGALADLDDDSWSL